jgi:nitrite reductase (NAD(P)H)
MRSSRLIASSSTLARPSPNSTRPNTRSLPARTEPYTTTTAFLSVRCFIEARPHLTSIQATGSDATLPSYADPKMKGVFVYRNISDLNKLLDYSQQPHVKGGKAVVVGGGLLGLEAAKAVYDLEEIKDVAIVNRQAFPLSRQLDNHGGEIVLRRIEAMGVQVLTHSSPTGIVTAEGHPDVFKGLTMNDGSVLEADLVIFSVGISPRDDLAKKAGIACEEKGGITVNDLLETSAKDVYAIGECASWNHNTYGLIAPGVEMADILSFNFTQLQTEVGGFKPRQMVCAFNTRMRRLLTTPVAEQSRPLYEAQAHGR